MSRKSRLCTSHLTFRSITGKKIAILGWAFKKDTGDSESSRSLGKDPHSDRPVARESPSITIANHFLSEKARISVYDPQVTESQIWLDLTE